MHSDVLSLKLLNFVHIQERILLFEITEVVEKNTSFKKFDQLKSDFFYIT